MSEPTCPSCGVPYIEHSGVVRLCEENQRLRRELADETSVRQMYQQEMGTGAPASAPKAYPDGERWQVILAHLQSCARLWAGDARLVGGLRAADIERACGDALAAAATEKRVR